VQASSSTDTANNTALPSGTVGLGQTKGQDEKGGALTVNLYVADDKPAAALHESAISPGPAAQPHENRMPLLALNFCIALSGTFPSRN
jgi:microcystin-dependent protein